ncbi:MAG: LamG-like jellyroll fold domain-containing protein [Dysgonomonas sp.]|nr:LamG-like jellyroll fold domain-containing protein [Dysgonomonas sp.]
MKTIYKYPILFIFIFSLAMGFTQCSDSDSFPSIKDLDSVILKAEQLLSSTEEGLNEGDYAPGSQKALQTKIQWARFIAETAESDDAIKKAIETLEADIEIYKNNTVKAGYPFYDKASEFMLGPVKDYPEMIDGFTIQFKAKMKDMDWNNLLCAEDGTGGIIMRRGGGSTMQAYVHNGGWVGGNVSFAFEKDIWYDLAMTFDGQTTKFYVDGVERMSVSGSKRNVNVLPDTKFKIGIHPTYAGRWFSGNVYKVSFWSFPKTKDEIDADRTIDFAGTETGLLAYWPMNLNVGSSILDKTGNHTAIGSQITWSPID